MLLISLGGFLREDGRFEWYSFTRADTVLNFFSLNRSFWLAETPWVLPCARLPLISCIWLRTDWLNCASVAMVEARVWPRDGLVLFSTCRIDSNCFDRDVY